MFVLTSVNTSARNLLIINQFTSRAFSHSCHRTLKKIPNATHDVIGPPNEISNLRPIEFHVPANESSIEKLYRQKREEVQQWNEAFWTNHNSKFFKEKAAFIAEKKNQDLSSVSSSPSSDQMSVFYKRFLDENWKVHQIYNFQWYCKNINLLLHAISVALYKITRKLVRNK